MHNQQPQQHRNICPFITLGCPLTVVLNESNSLPLSKGCLPHNKFYIKPSTLAPESLCEPHKPSQDWHAWALKLRVCLATSLRQHNSFGIPCCVGTLAIKVQGEDTRHISRLRFPSAGVIGIMQVHPRGAPLASRGGWGWGHGWQHLLHRCTVHQQQIIFSCRTAAKCECISLGSAVVYGFIDRYRSQLVQCTFLGIWMFRDGPHRCRITGVSLTTTLSATCGLHAGKGNVTSLRKPTEALASLQGCKQSAVQVCLCVEVAGLFWQHAYTPCCQCHCNAGISSPL